MVTKALPPYKNEKLLESRLKFSPDYSLVFQAIDCLSRLICVLNATAIVDTRFSPSGITSENIKSLISEEMAATILSLIELQNVYDNFTEIAAIMGQKMAIQYKTLVWNLGKDWIFDTDNAKQVLNSIYGDCVKKEQNDEQSNS